MVRKRILFGPAVNEVDTLSNLLARIGHYFAHVGVERVAIPLGPDLTTEEARRELLSPRLPSGFDSMVLEGLGRVARSIEFIDHSTSVENFAITSDMLLVWDSSAFSQDLWTNVARGYRSEQTLFNVDWLTTRADGSWFAEAAKAMFKPSRRYDPGEATRFLNRTRGFLGTDKAYLVATGPTARSALAIDMADGIRIVCNTVILDEELMDHVDPDIVTFADPIFHFGPSTYAHRFQQALLSQARMRDFTIVTIDRYSEFLKRRMPELRNRIVGARMGNRRWTANLDLRHEFAVRPYPNILTMLMIPLATTFARNLLLIGFDGRAHDETYFWRHGATVQLREELENIRQVHQGFFELDFEDYYDEHVGAVEDLFKEIEIRGGTVRPLTPSFMEPLRRRATDPNLHPLLLDPAKLARPENDVLISITPDWTNDFGHFGPWERTLRSAATSMKLDYRTFASKAIQPDSMTEMPVFTDASTQTAPFDTTRFEEELRNALADSIPDQSRCYVVFYTADVWHLPPLLSVARDNPGVTFAVNLMRSHPLVTSGLTSDNGWHQAVADLLRKCLDAATNTNLTITIDTNAIAADLYLRTGRTVLVWPMIMVADPEALAEAGRKPAGSAIRIISPVQPQQAKGFPELAQLARRLDGRLRSGKVTLETRYVSQPTGIRDGTIEQAQTFKEHGGTLIEGTMTDQEYVSLVGSADIVLLPYRYDPFRTRTSGVVLDAVAAGKPVVAVRGTWAGNLVDEFGIGRTFTDGNIDQFLTAMDEILNHLPEMNERVAENRDDIVEMFRPARLVEFVKKLGNRDDLEAPDESQVQNITELASTISGVFQGRSYQLNRKNIDRFVDLDNQERQKNDLKDTVESLRRAVLWRQKQIDQLTAGAKHDQPTKQIQAALSTSLEGNVYLRDSHAHLDELALVADLMQPHEVENGLMIDVGAHHGSAFRRFRTAGWRILAFEPDPRHKEYLSERFDDDALVELDTRAVSDNSGGKVPFYISDESTGISSLNAFHESHTQSGLVETVALRDVIGDDPIHLLKIDTEGHEMAVINGFPWNRLAPEVVVAEFEDLKTLLLGYTYHDLAKRLVDLGYQVWVSEWHPIVRYGVKHDWHQMALYPSDLKRPDAWGNFIALKSPITSEDMGAALSRCLEVAQRPTNGSESAATTVPLERDIAKPPVKSVPRPRRARRARRLVGSALRSVGIEPSDLKRRFRVD